MTVLDLFRMVHTTHNRQLKRLAGKIEGEPCAPQMINTRNYMLERLAANIANNFKRHSNDPETSFAYFGERGPRRQGFGISLWN